MHRFYNGRNDIYNIKKMQKKGINITFNHQEIINKIAV